jgi:hypothetical protein
MTATAGEQAGPVYLDSCVLLSLFLGDSGFDASETWLLSRDGTELWISHWVLLEFAGVVATCVRRGQLTAERARWIESEFECFRQERLRLLEPRGSDFLQARQWLQQSQDPWFGPVCPSPGLTSATDRLTDASPACLPRADGQGPRNRHRHRHPNSAVQAFLANQLATTPTVAWAARRQLGKRAVRRARNQSMTDLGSPAVGSSALLITRKI